MKNETADMMPNIEERSSSCVRSAVVTPGACRVASTAPIRVTVEAMRTVPQPRATNAPA